VSPTQHNYEAVASEIRCENLPEVLLVRLHLSRDLEVAKVLGTAEQTLERLRAGIGCQTV
jgi:hypothetical protein